jgi:hypothetical protein
MGKQRQDHSGENIFVKNPLIGGFFGSIELRRVVDAITVGRSICLTACALFVTTVVASMPAIAQQMVEWGSIVQFGSGGTWTVILNNYPYNPYSCTRTDDPRYSDAFNPSIPKSFECTSPNGWGGGGWADRGLTGGGGPWTDRGPTGGGGSWTDRGPTGGGGPWTDRGPTGGGGPWTDRGLTGGGGSWTDRGPTGGGGSWTDRGPTGGGGPWTDRGPTGGGGPWSDRGPTGGGGSWADRGPTGGGGSWADTGSSPPMRASSASPRGQRRPESKLREEDFKAENSKLRDENSKLRDENSKLREENAVKRPLKDEQHQSVPR